MAGTSEGSKRAAATTMRRRGKDHFRKIGKTGGETNKQNKGQYLKDLAKNDPDKLKEMSAKGGRNGKRKH